MGIQKVFWEVAKKGLTGGIIGLTISDRCFSVVPVRGDSMSPTFNPQGNSYLDDYVLVDKFRLRDYKFARGDVVVLSSPTHFRDRYIKRIVGLPGEWISSSQDVIRVPEGHCWVQGDNKTTSFDSRTFGPIPLGLIQGRVTHVVWPPQSKQNWLVKLMERKRKKEKGMFFSYSSKLIFPDSRFSVEEYVFIPKND